MSLLVVKAADLLSQWHGGSEGNVSQLFAILPVLQPVVLQIDEVEGLIQTTHTHGASLSLARAFQVEIDRTGPLALGIFLVLTSNDYEATSGAMASRCTRVQFPLRQTDPLIRMVLANLMRDMGELVNAPALKPFPTPR